MLSVFLASLFLSCPITTRTSNTRNSQYVAHSDAIMFQSNVQLVENVCNKMKITPPITKFEHNTNSVIQIILPHTPNHTITHAARYFQKNSLKFFEIFNIYPPTAHYNLLKSASYTKIRNMLFSSAQITLQNSSLGKVLIQALYFFLTSILALLSLNKFLKYLRIFSSVLYIPNFRIFYYYHLSNKNVFRCGYFL